MSKRCNYLLLAALFLSACSILAAAAAATAQQHPAGNIIVDREILLDDAATTEEEDEIVDEHNAENWGEDDPGEEDWDEDEWTEEDARAEREKVESVARKMLPNLSKLSPNEQTTVYDLFEFKINNAPDWWEGSELDRMIGYHQRDYSWPLPEYVPATEGWKKTMDERFRQVSEVTDSRARWEGYIQTINSAYMIQNFTEHGFGLARAPEDLMVELRKAIRDGLPTARYEEDIEEIDAPEQPLFIDRPDLTERVLHELKPYVEEWSGVELTPHKAYGFRLYQNQSQLTMHVDR